MKTELDYSEAPHNYTLCLHRDCPLADTCLRQLAEKSIPATLPACLVIRPAYLASLTTPCPYYRSSGKVRFAKGFVRLLEELPHKQMRTVVAHLIDQFGRRTYYRTRKGERLLSPSEQETFRNVLKKCGVSPVPEFDLYIEKYDW